MRKKKSDWKKNLTWKTACYWKMLNTETLYEKERLKPKASYVLYIV